MKANFSLKTHGRGPAMPDKILIDTSVWIEFFRKKESSVSVRLREYLKLNQACYTGPVAVELYQGAKTGKEIKILDQLFQTIAYVEITRNHYHHAGLISQKAAREGIRYNDVLLQSIPES